MSTRQSALDMAWRWSRVALRYEDAEPGTPEFLLAEIYDRHAHALLNIPEVAARARWEMEQQAEWHWGDTAETEQHVGTPGFCTIPTCTAPPPF